MPTLRFDDCRELVFREASRQVHRLARRYNLQPADRDDVFQEITLDAWRRLPGYRSHRGDIEPFLGVVTLNQARKIDARLRGRHRNHEISLDAPIASRGADGAPLTLAECLTENDGLPALLGNQIDGHARVETTLDLSRAISSLPYDMQRLCACLAHEAPGMARRMCALSNTEMYRRIGELRLHLLAFGFGAS